MTEKLNSEQLTINDISLYDIVEHAKFGRGIVIPSDNADTDSAYTSKLMVRFFRYGVAPKYLSFDGLQAKELNIVNRADVFVHIGTNDAYRITQTFTVNAESEKQWNHLDGTHMVSLASLNDESGLTITLRELTRDYVHHEHAATVMAGTSALLERTEYAGTRGSLSASDGGTIEPLKDVTGVHQALDLLKLMTDPGRADIMRGAYGGSSKHGKQVAEVLKYLGRNIGITEGV